MLLSELQIKALQDLILDIEENGNTFTEEAKDKYKHELGHLYLCDSLIEQLTKVIETNL